MTEASPDPKTPPADAGRPYGSDASLGRGVLKVLAAIYLVWFLGLVLMALFT